MSYTVVKWVKGHPYLYRQTSFREGKSVRTVSTYLGPAGDGAASGGAGGSADTPSATTMEIAPQVESAAPPVALPAETAPPPPPKPSVPPADRLTVTANLERLGISERSLRYHYTDAMRRLAASGIDPGLVPPVVVRYGLQVGVKSRWRRGYAVTLPFGAKVNARAVRDAYHRAVARACLDAMHQQQPEAYARLSLQMDASFRATNEAAIRFVTNTRMRGALAWALTLRFFGIAHALKWKGGGIDAKTIGLPEYGERGDWHDETAAVLGGVLAKGYGPSWRAHQREYGKAIAAEKAAERAYLATGFFGRRAARRKWQRAQARVAAHAEIGHKLRSLQTSFGFG